MSNPLVPSVSLLAKIGSIVVHADELTSDGGHEFDAAALRDLLRDPDVTAWLDAMSQAALVPKKRA